MHKISRRFSIINNKEIIEGLNSEFHKRNGASFDEIYVNLESYVNDKQSLEKMIKLGMLQYEYMHFDLFIRDTCYQEYFEYVIDLCRNAYTNDCEWFLKFVSDKYESISKSYSNYMKSSLLQIRKNELNRIDLFAKSIFDMIGSLIEGSIKPFLSFVYDLDNHSKNLTPNNDKLGTMAAYMISEKDFFEVILKCVLFDISISQWRNIAYHNSYFVINDDIKVIYGSNNQYSKLFNREKLEYLFCALNCFYFTNKLLFTLISSDYCDDVILRRHLERKSEHEIQDSLRVQFVETAFAYDMKVLDLEINEGFYKVFLDMLNASIEQLIEFSKIIFSLKKDKTEIVVRRNGAYRYSVIQKDDRLIINGV